MSLELGRALLLADAVTPEAMSRALLAAVKQRICLARALLATDAIDPARLEVELARAAPELPLQPQPVAVLELLERLPARLCEALLALPVRQDALTGTVDVALADPLDHHAINEVAFFLEAPVRLVRAPLGALEAAIVLARRQSSRPPPSGPVSVPPPSPVRAMTHTPPWGSPAFDAAAAPPHVDERASMVSERPIPLVRSPSEQAPVVGAGEIPIPLSRRLTPGAGLVAVARATQAMAADDEEPVVELRRTKPPSTRAQTLIAPPPPNGVPVPSTPPASPPAPAPIASPAPAASIPPRIATPSVTASASASQILREMGKASARDPLLELVLLALRPLAPKTVLFAVKKDAFVGWMCGAEFGDRTEVANLRVAADVPSLLSTLATVGTYVGTLRRNEAHEPLFKYVRASRPEVIGASIKAAGKPVFLVLCHDVAEPLRAMTVLTDVVRVAGESLERILRTKR